MRGKTSKLVELLAPNTNQRLLVGHNRPTMQRESDLVLESELSAKGYPIHEIADRIGVSVSVVSEDLKIVRQRWLERMLGNAGDWVSAEVAKLDQVERAAWQSYERSLRSTANAPDGRDGKAEYLEIVIRCSESRRKLMGLDSDRQLDMSEYLAVEAKRHGLDPSIVIANANQYLLESGDRQG